MVEVTLNPKFSVSVEGVRSECKRRMRQLLGARDNGHLDILISNGTRDAVRLLRKGEGNWTSEDTLRAATLAAADDAVEAIRDASNVLETVDTIPDDYADDKHWP